MYDVGVIGGGAWGTALAVAAIAGKNKTAIWAREPEVIDSINKSNENQIFLPNIRLSKELKAIDELNKIVQSKIILLVPPAQFLRPTCTQLKSEGINPKTPIVICSKGIEKKSLKLMSEVASEILPNPIAVLTGPTFAAEVAKGLPVFMTLACENNKIRNDIAATMNSDNVKIRPIDDIIGAQIGGSVKNVIAIACGIVEGKGLGENAKAALITGGAREIEELTIAKGGKHETVMRLCGLGDLILTCSSKQSRNFSLGYALGQGKTMQQAMEGKKSVAEGVESAESVTDLAEKLGIKLPICSAVRTIIKGGNIDKVIRKLIDSY